MSDRIRIRGLEVFANHGVYEEETKLGQKFLVDVSLHLDTRKAGFSDDIHDSVDYGSVCHFITKYMKEHTFRLLEAVAEQLRESFCCSCRRLAGWIWRSESPGRRSVCRLRKWLFLSAGDGIRYISLWDRIWATGQDVSVLRMTDCPSIPYIRDVRISSLYETAP